MILYTALGDSITAGEGSSHPAMAFPHQIVASARSRSLRMTGVTLARSGWTSSDLLLALLDHDPSPIQRSHVTSIWVGGDNLIRAGLFLLGGANKNALPGMLSCYKRDLTVMIRTIRGSSRTKIVLCTQYNPFPHSPIAALAIDSLNAVTEQAANQNRTLLAPTHLWFEGNQAQLIAGYRSGQLEKAAGENFPVHPNNRGHRVIALGLLPYLIN